jgi:hypothetical protein
MAINANDIKKHAGIKQEQGEPVAYCEIHYLPEPCVQCAKEHEGYNTPLVKQEHGEPVAWCWRSVSTGELFDFTERLHPEDLESDNLVPLYTTPQQRKPLTDEQIANIVIEMNGNEPPALFWKDLTRAIEAAHGIKE